MLFIRLSLIHEENPTTPTQYTLSLQFQIMPFRLLTVELMMCDPSLMHTRIRLFSSEICMTVATTKLPCLITTSSILPHPILTAIAAMSFRHNHERSPRVLPLCHQPYSCSCMSLDPSGLIWAFWWWRGGVRQPGALNGPVNFSQEPHHIHDKTIDTSPGTGPNNIHDSVPEDDVSIVTNIKELTRFAWWQQDLHAMELLRAHIREWTITRMLDYWWVMCFTSYRLNWDPWIWIPFPVDLDCTLLCAQVDRTRYSSIASGNNCIVQLCKCVSLHL